MGTILVGGSKPGLLRASPGRNGQGQAPPAAAWFAVARLGPQCPGVGGRGRRRWCRVLGKWGCRKRAPALVSRLWSPRVPAGASQGGAEVAALEMAYCPADRGTRFFGSLGCFGEKKPSGRHLTRFPVLKAYFLSLQCQGARRTVKLFGFCVDKASANCPHSSREQNQTETYHSE